VFAALNNQLQTLLPVPEKSAANLGDKIKRVARTEIFCIQPEGHQTLLAQNKPFASWLGQNP
jgi:hypothetical protein